jgi:hypothetical protein
MERKRKAVAFIKMQSQHLALPKPDIPKRSAIQIGQAQIASIEDTVQKNNTQ